MLNMMLNGDNGAGMDLMGGMQTMGIVNALKTGDLYLDMLIAMLIPIFLRFAFDMFRRLDNNLSWSNLCKWWKSRSFKYERTIVYKYQRSYWGGTNNLDEDTQNTVLLKAIKFYLHQCCKLDFRDAMIDLTTIGQQQRHNYYDYYDSEDEDEDQKTMVGTLAKYKIVAKPKNGCWHSVGRYDGHVVEIMVSEEEEEQSSGDNSNSNKNVTSTKTFHFVSTGKTSIDTFIQKAYDWYLEQLRSLEDHSRYMYEIRQKAKNEDTDGGAMTYNRYKLSDEKTFESLFFRQKESLLNLMNHFQNKSGKYSIKGYPHKLGLLLHGVPGTGKTSLIKALAQHTGRSIVNIPLSKIETNSELMDIFFAKQYSVANQDVPVKLSFKDIIFVLEDVDAASKVVKRRVAEAAPKPTITVKTPWQLLLESNDEETREVVKILKDKSTRLKEAADAADVLQSLAQRIGSVPGLGVINSKGVDRETREEALESANSTIDALETVDRYIGVHAKTIKASLDAGVAVSTAFEDALLGSYNGGAVEHVVSPSTSEEVSLAGDDGMTDDAQQQMIVQAAMAMSTENNTDASAPAPGAAGPSFLLKPKKDELNLSGLLNVLDGVVDTPGRIVVMTTNHPEMLDPALIRPGRIDKKILLGFMGGTDMIQMVELYFQTSLNLDQANRFRQVAAELELTPAEVEQMAAEHDLVEDMLYHLEVRAGLVAAKSSPVY